jgi:hypothetical protein
MHRRAILWGLVLTAALSGVLAAGATSAVERAAVGTATTQKQAQSPLLFDGRALRVDELWSMNADDQRASPHIWDCLCFQNNDISLASDSRYAKVYAVRAGAGSSNPWYNVGAGKAASQTSAIRPNRLGKWDWYGIAVQVQPGFVSAEWATVAQFNYPSLSAPPASLNLRSVRGRLYWSLARNAGYLYRPTVWGWEGRVREEPTVIPADIGKWTEFVIGIRWATDATGQVRVYTRVKDDGQKHFRLKLVRRNTPTWQYGATPSGNVRADGTDAATGEPHSTIDMEGLYFGYSAPPSPFPTNRVLERGMIRADEASAAFSRMP